MLVQDVYTTGVVTVTPETTLPDAVRLTRERGIRHLPVVDGGKLVGIISDRDLKRAMASPATSLEAHELNYLLSRLGVGEIMTRAVITVSPTLPIEEAARLMVSEKVSALPVTDGARLVGIVTETDLLNLFVRAMDTHEPSGRVEIMLDDRPSALAEVVQAFEQTGATVSSVMTLPLRGGGWEAVVRFAASDPAPAVAALEAKGYTIRHHHIG